MNDAQSFTSQILNTYNPNSIIPFTDTDGFYHFTYLTINTINNKFYLGKHTTKDLNDGYIGSGIAFKNAIRKHGQSNFQHYRLQFFNTAQDAYIAEALLITEDVIKKYRDELKVCYNLKTGGFGGGGLSEESKEKRSKASKETRSKAEYKEKHSKSMKEACARPEVKEKMSKAIKEACARPEVKEKHRSAIKEAWSRPEYKEKRSKAMKELYARPEVKEKHSKALKESHARPEVKEKLSKASKESHARPEYKEKQSKAMKENWSRPEVKEKHRSAIKEMQANKEMIYQSTGEKKTVHTNDVLSHLKAGWTFTQGSIIIYNKKLNIQKTIMFKNKKDKGALYKRLIGYLENGYEIGKRPRGIKSEVFVVVAGSEYCGKRKMVSLF
jgi:hypothetical protein